MDRKSITDAFQIFINSFLMDEFNDNQWQDQLRSSRISLIVCYLYFNRYLEL